MEKISFVLAAAMLGGCGGSASEKIVIDPSSETVFVGSVPVVVDDNGAIAGVEGQSLSVLPTDAGTVLHGVVRDVDAALIGNPANAAVGDTRNFVESGFASDVDVGANYLSGTATYTGEYEMTVVTGYEDSSNPDNWTTEVLEGPVEARIELHTAIEAENDPDHGHSHDVDVVELFIGAEGDPLFFEEVIIYSPSGPARPSSTIGDFNGGFANVAPDSDPIPLRGQVAFGGDGLVASFQGSDAEHLVAGGFGLTASDTSDLQTD